MISDISTDLGHVSVNVDSASALQAEFRPAADIVFMESQGVEVVLITAQHMSTAHKKIASEIQII